MSELQLAGRAAVITGGASGIGRALARACAREGMAVGIADLEESRLAETAQELADLGAAVSTAVVDVSSAAAVADWAADCLGRYDSIAAVFSNAGVLVRDDATAPDISAWDHAIDVNLRGAVNCLAAFAPPLIERGEPSQIVFTASLGAFSAVPGIAPYCVTKRALWGLAENARAEYEIAGLPLGVSLMAPPRIATPMISRTIDNVRAEQGDEAAARYTAALPTADQMAAAGLTGVRARRFYIWLRDADDAAFRQATRERLEPVFATSD
jgi:NAD(P)-dependent dehydrogenase (short-subunit alcohol dehydrogenase family)